MQELTIKDILKILKKRWWVIVAFCILEKDSYILYLARIVPEKGLHYLLEAFKGIDTDKRLVVAGDSSHTDDYLEKIKRMAAEDERVIMTGFVKGEVLEELYSNCYLYVLPSDVEGMPLTLLEAMSYGCRCLVSDIPENLEVIQEIQSTFACGNVLSLQEKLRELVVDKAKKNNLMNAVIKWSKVIDDTVCIYKF